jgi:hypothetical protein
MDVGLAVVTMEVAQLVLNDAVLRRTIYDGNVTRYPESHYLDFVIDGQRLRDRLLVAPDMTTLLNRAWLPSVESAVLELLGKRPTAGLDAGRVFLFVCGECGDLGCGAVTAALDVDSDRITWSQFAWESGYEPAEPIDSAPDSLAFGAADYEKVFASAYGRVAALPYDELAHQGRKFLWPWQWGWRLPKDGQ